MSDPVTTGAEPRRSPLHDAHVARGAKFAPFGGWLMPLEYAGGGVVAEHTAVRESVGLFDVSHLGKARVRGAGAVDFLNRCFTADLGALAEGRAQWTMCLDDATGGVVDDLLAYRYADDHVFLVPNAANNAEVVRRLSAAAPPGVTVTDEHEAYAVLAVQGPAAPDVLGALGLPVGHEFMSFTEVTYDGVPVVVCRTGYTGEHGYELVVPAEAAGPLWERLLAAVEAHNGLPCGLGARDTLRTEAGLPLHGQDLSLEITPLQARCGWAVAFDKPEFWGQRALLAEREAGPRRVRWGLRATGRGVPRAGMTVLRGATPVGVVTSGTFSPTLRTGIALALLDTAAKVTEGDELTVDVRGRGLPVRVVRPPFVPHRNR